ncbi:MAG: acyl-CoA dehydrogenase [Actinobacteria bacterium]|nr:acyl-CoA dehydrogenase [Actinomycetota bacterium]
MMLGISEDHLALHETARRWVEAHVPPSVPRARLDAPEETLPEFWGTLGDLGWLGLLIHEEYGGQGYGAAELAVVLEELGRACAPGPFLSTALAAWLIQWRGPDELKRELLPELAAGSRVGAVGFSEPVLSANLADVFVLEVDGRWCVFDRGQVDVTLLPSLDATRRVARVEVIDPDPLGVLDPLPEPHSVLGVASLLLSAESVGGAQWCVDTAASYAKVREQFGRPIGQFQAVKHRCAGMLMDLERARAAAWDAARGGAPAPEEALAIAVASSLAPEAFFRCAKDVIQVLGGIGFTWEHDAHLYLKRATAVRQLLGGPAPWRRRAVELASAGTRRTLTVALPEAAEGFRAEVRAFLDELATREKSEWNGLLADSGYLVAHYPAPWGLGATPVQQLVIDEEFARVGVRRPHLQVGAWVLPTLIAHGTPSQQERFVPPTLRLEISWCQLFSEPGAGSDLAGLSTKAVRDEGGWLVSGQKVWTTFAHQTDYGLCLARTDPSAPKHEGITCFVVDMRSEGIDIRPLRELTGADMFNEVFFEDVFVPDECVIGAVNDGWRVGRTTLENERVSMGSGSSFGWGVEALLGMVDASDHVTVDEVGELLAEAEALAVMGHRMTVRSLSGMEPGPESSVRKLLGVEHDQRVQEVGMTLVGPAASATEGDAAAWVAGFLANRCLTIAGGTSEIQRNVIAERLLGLPKDP